MRVHVIAEAIIEDGSCTYSETYFDCNGNCINDSDADGICDELEVPGVLIQTQVTTTT